MKLRPLCIALAIMFFTASYACFRLPSYEHAGFSAGWMYLCGTVMLFASFVTIAGAILGIKVEKQ